MRSRKHGRIWIAVLCLLALAGLTGGAALFQPWRLLVDERADEPLPAVVLDQPIGPSSSSPMVSATPSLFPSAASPTTKPARPPSDPVTLRRGRLISHEHPTSGRVTIVALADGRRVLRLEDLDTTSGPDLRVWLSDGPVIAGRDGWFVFARHPSAELGPLKANHGNQNYLIPAEVDLDDYRSAVIWCKRFKVSFGAAELS